MGKKNAGKLLAAVLAGLAAVLWTANCIVLIVYTKDIGLPKPLLIADVLCAALWWLSFGVNLARWRRSGGGTEADQTGRGPERRSIK